MSCHKQVYDTKEKALAATLRFKGKNKRKTKKEKGSELYYYYCIKCNGYHITSQPWQSNEIFTKRYRACIKNMYTDRNVRDLPVLNKPLITKFVWSRNCGPTNQ